MNGKELFKAWAPNEAYLWTKYAKPALFVNLNDFVFSNKNRVRIANIPNEIEDLLDMKTVVIVDFSGSISVEKGIGLANLGLRPVPLYNGIHEAKTGTLSSVIDNTPIIEALISGAEILQNLDISADAPPVFLLDYNRDKKVLDLDGKYDNRWAMELEDMPDASYLKLNHINRAIIWTEGELHEDLIPIINCYQDSDIEVLTLTHDNPAYEKHNIINEEMGSAIAKEKSSSYNKARTALKLLTILSFFNLFGQYFVNEEPLLWTAPSLPWLNYLWMSEGMADLLAIVIPFVYLKLYLSSEKKSNSLKASLIFFGIDVFIFSIYVLTYGINAFVEGSIGYAVVAFGLPLYFLSSLIKGVQASKGIDGENGYDSNREYSGGNRRGMTKYRTVRRSSGAYRGYRGYDGYGGSGTGGYNGKGYSSSSSRSFGG